MRNLTTALRAFGYDVLAKYIDKKVHDSGNITYIYDEDHIKERNKKKAQQVAKLQNAITDLRAKVNGDLESADAKARLTALAVGLIDATYERIGNDLSADQGHLGVTGWKIKNVNIRRSHATITYVGKAGVSQEKIVKNNKLVRALKNVIGNRANGYILYDADSKYRVTAKDVNDYLKAFEVTAKDLRGFHANREMVKHLQNIRKDGGLPEDKDERDKILKSEFKEALNKVAALVGHEAATLRSSYLVPSLEESFLTDGTIISAFY